MFSSSCWCLLFAITAVHGAANYGTDFYIGALKNFQGNTVHYTLHMATLESSVNYEITNYAGTTISSGTVTSGSTGTIVKVPSSYVTNSNSVSERNEGLYLSASGPVSVLVVNYQYATVSEYPAYPKQTFSVYQYEYYTAAPSTSLVSYANSEVLIVGTEDNTVVTFTPKVNVVVPSDINSASTQTLSAGATKQYTINRLQTLYFGVSGSVSQDLTGTVIVSDKPLTVIAGHECANIPSPQAYCEHVEEQIPPTVTWGTEYLIHAFSGKNDYSYLLIVSSEDTTKVEHNCPGSKTEFSLVLAGNKNTITVNNGNGCYIKADKPILITQMMTGGNVGGTGDPAVAILPPMQHHTNEVVFQPPSQTYTQYFDINYINIIMKDKDDNIQMDGSPINPTWSQISDFNGGVAGYYARITPPDTNVHSISTPSGRPFNVLVYGYASTALAGYAFSANVGLLEQLVGGKLQVKPWYGNILGGVAFVLKGPQFQENDKIECEFNDLRFPCNRIDEGRHALCVSPRLTFTRRITLRLYQNGEKYISDSRFYSLPIDESSAVNIIDIHYFLTSTQTVQLSWVPTSMLPDETGIDPSSLLIDIALHRIVGDGSNILETISTVASGVPNTGIAPVTIPVLEDGADDHINICAFSLTLYDDPEATTVVSSLNTTVNQWCTNVWVAFSEPDEIDDILWNQCMKWAETEPLPDIRNELLRRTRSTPCPPTVAQANTPNSGLVRDTHPFFTEYFHPAAGSCYRQRTITSANLGSGNECCYTSGGNLIVGPYSGGSINKVDPRAPTMDYWDTVRMHFKEDVVPYLFCCRGGKKACQVYYDRRPSDDGSRYRPPVPACVYGDPHIVTLDLLKYTFNGKGEFVLIETPDFHPSFNLNARMTQVKDGDGNDVKATVFSAIVAKQEDSDTVQFELQGSGDEITIVTYVNGEEIDLSELKMQEFNNVTVTNTGNNTLNAIFSTGAYITVAETNGLISTLVVYLPDMYQSQTQGLMGNYNNDTSDDLTRKGTSLPLSVNAPLKQIHDFFGKSYMVTNEGDSMFNYTSGSSFSSYHDPDFVPLFETIFSSVELEQQANDICGDDKFCLFDIAASGKVEIGMETKQGSTNFEKLQELSLPITCDPPCVNGACTDTNVCSCSEGYMGELCNQTNAAPCTFDPCQNGGECGEIAGSAVCTCPCGFTGYFCDVEITCTETTTTAMTTAVTTTTSRTTVMSTTSLTRSSSATSSTVYTRPTTSTTQTPTRPPDTGRSTGISTTSAAIIGIVVGLVILVVVAVVIVVVIIFAKRGGKHVSKYPVEEMKMGKANPAYEEMDEFHEENDGIYEIPPQEDKDILVG